MTKIIMTERYGAQGETHVFMYILGVQQAQASLSFFDNAVQIDTFNHTLL